MSFVGIRALNSTGSSRRLDCKRPQRVALKVTNWAAALYVIALFLFSSGALADCSGKSTQAVVAIRPQPQSGLGNGPFGQGAFSADHTLFAIVSSAGAGIWDTNSGLMVRSLKIEDGHQFFPPAFDKSKKTLVVFGRDVVGYCIATGERSFPADANSRAIWGPQPIAVSADQASDTAVEMLSDGTVKLLDLSTGLQKGTWKSNIRDQAAIVVIPGKDLLAVAPARGGPAPIGAAPAPPPTRDITVYSLSTGKIVERLPGCGNWTDTLAADSAGLLGAIQYDSWQPNPRGEMSECVVVWRLPRDSNPRVFSFGAGRLHGLAFDRSAKAAFVLTGSSDWDGRLIRLSLDDGSQTEQHEKQITDTHVASAPNSAVWATWGTDRTVKLWVAGKKPARITELRSVDQNFLYAALNAKSDGLFVASPDGVEQIDLRRGLSAWSHHVAVTDASESAAGTEFVGLGYEGGFKLLHGSTSATDSFTLAALAPESASSSSEVFLSPDASVIVTITSVGGTAKHMQALRTKSVSSGKLSELFDTSDMSNAFVRFSPDSRYLLATGKDSLVLWNLRDHTRTALPVPPKQLRDAYFSADSKSVNIATLDKDLSAIRFDLGGHAIAHVGQHELGAKLLAPWGDVLIDDADLEHNRIWSPRISEIGKIQASPVFDVVATDGRRMYQLEPPPGRHWQGLAESANVAKPLTDQTIVPILLSAGTCHRLFETPGDHLVCIAYDGDIYIWAKATGHFINRVLGNGEVPANYSESADGRYLTVVYSSGRVAIIDLAIGKTSFSIYYFGLGNWVIETPRNEYLATAGGAEGLGFVIGTSAYPFEAFDRELNRPSEVLASIGKADQNWLSVVKNAEHKRRSRDTVAGSVTNALTLVIKNIAQLGGEGFGVSAPLQFSADSSQNPIIRINVTDNGVPLTQVPGTTVNTQLHSEGTINVPLEDGLNRLDVEAQDSAGATSVPQRVLIYAENTARKPDLWLLSVGVAHYDDPSIQPQLHYSQDDATELVRAFEALRPNYSQIHTLPIPEQLATRENILAAKDFFSKSQPNDVLVAFLSGHGLPGPSHQYFFGTKDVAKNYPERRGVSLDELNGLLASAPARKRLILLDTCNAGVPLLNVAGTEPLEENPLPSDDNEMGREAGSRRTNGELSQTDQSTLAWLLDDFVQLDDTTGVKAITASTAYSPAFESDTFRHGYFTKAILELLQTESVKKHGLRLSELRDGVVRKVTALTAGKQKTVAQQTAAESDFTIVPPND